MKGSTTPYTAVLPVTSVLAAAVLGGTRPDWGPAHKPSTVHVRVYLFVGATA